MAEKSKILIIEDDPDLIETAKIILENEGYIVVAAFDTEDGMRKVEQEVPDLIILDVMFGNKQHADGFSFTQVLRQNKTLSYIPILMVTSINVELPQFHFSPETDGAYLPVDGFIDKPAQPEDLTQKVKELLSLKISKWAGK